MDLNCGIYKIICSVNDMYYVGSSKHLNKRWRQHLSALRRNVHVNRYLQFAFNAYGESNFTFHIVEYCSPDNLQEVEDHYLSQTGSDSYNFAKKYGGGDLVSQHPLNSEIRSKISTKSKEIWDSRSEEYMKQFSEKRKGENNHNYGNRWSDELRKRVSSVCMGRKNPHKGKKLEDIVGTERANSIKERISRLASQRTGEKNHFFGKQHSEATKRALSEIHTGMQKNPSNIRKVIIDGVHYRSLCDAARELNVCSATIIHRIKSENPKFKGYYYLDTIECPTTILEGSTSQAIGDGKGRASM